MRKLNTSASAMNQTNKYIRKQIVATMIMMDAKHKRNTRNEMYERKR